MLPNRDPLTGVSTEAEDLYLLIISWCVAQFGLRYQLYFSWIASLAIFNVH